MIIRLHIPTLKLFNPLLRIPAWKEADRLERSAKKRGCTREIGKARASKYEAVHRALGRREIGEGA